MRITSKQLRQIIREELARTVPLREAKKRFTPTPEMIAQRDPVTGFMPHPRDIAAAKARQEAEALAQDIAGALGPVDDFGDEESEEDEDQVAFDKVYGHTRGTLPDGRRLDPVTEKLIISQVEEQSSDSLISGEDFPIFPNAYDIYEGIDPSVLLHNMQQVARGRDPVAARTSMAWLKYLKENEADAESILHKAVYETLKHAASIGQIAMNDKKAHMRWDVQEFYALPSGEINESRRKRR